MPDNAYDLFQEAVTLLEKRRPSRAASLLEKAKVLEPRRGSILEALGRAYYNSGNHDGALREFEEALDIDPTNHYARYGLGRCLYKRGMMHEAIGQVKLAAVMAPEIDDYTDILRRYQWELDLSGRE